MTLSLEEENLALRMRIVVLEKEVEFLKTHPSIAQGIRGETLVARITGGVIGAYADQHDILVGQRVKIEVKFSKLNSPNSRASTKRWNWSKPLGWQDKGKDYDFLLLVGEKDLRFTAQYLDESPYVFFLVPRSEVLAVMSSGVAIGANVQIISNLAKAKSASSIAIQHHMVPEHTINELLANVEKS
jgi:hypothetical protein